MGEIVIKIENLSKLYRLGQVGTGTLGHDLNPASSYYSGTSAVVYETSGTAPNRVMTIEWSNVPSYGSSYNLYNFQVKLYETTNVIEF